MSRKITNIVLLILISSAANAQQATPPWTYTETEENHVIAVPLSVNPTIDATPLVRGDYIGVFYDSAGTLACGGYVMWNDSSNVPVIAWMDQSLTNNVKEGFTPGETFNWKIWRASDSTEFLAYASFLEGPEVFTFRGYSVLDSLYKIDDIGPPWYFTRTGINHIILVPSSGELTIEGSPVQLGDYLGVFYDSANTTACAGYVRWEGVSTSLTAWGDDPATSTKDGLSVGEEFQWKMWRRADQREFNAYAVYDTTNRVQFPNDSLFVVNGISAILALRTTAPTVPQLRYILDYRWRFDRPLTFSGNYRLLSLPGDSTLEMTAPFFKGQPIEDWVAFYDNGEELYLPYNESNKDQFKFRPGRAFWVISKFDVVIDSLNVPGVTIGRDSIYTLRLKEGWNVIATPFPETIPWDTVRQLNNNIQDKLWRFSGGKYNSATNMEAFKGYYFYNRLELEFLQIPYIGNNDAAFVYIRSGVSTPPEAPGQNYLKIILEDDHPVSEAIIVHEDDASYGLDDHDVFTPPPGFEIYRIMLKNNKLESEYKYLNKEARPFTEKGEIFDLRIKAPGQKYYNISVEGTENFTGRDIQLYKESSKQFFDLTGNLTVRVYQSDNYENYKLLIGSGDFINESKKKITGGFVLYQNHPNPFNPTTSISYMLTEESRVELSIYNALGEEIEKTVRNYTAPGTYDYQWDGSNYSSGVYFYSVTIRSLETGSINREVKKMLLIK